MTTTLIAPALPSELRGAWVYPGATPASRARADRQPVGVLLSHGDHCHLVLWTAVEGAPPPATLMSLAPLTLADTLTCPSCGRTGRIIADRWEPC